MRRSRAADYPGEPRRRVAINQGGDHPAINVAADYPGEPRNRVANSQGCAHHVLLSDPVQLLGHGSSTVRELHVQLEQVLLHQCNSDILRAQIRRVLGPWDFADWEHAADDLLLDPEHVGLDVPHLVEARYTFMSLK